MLNYPYEPFDVKYVDAMGIRTGYYEAGEPNNRPVLLLHGMSTSADSFRETMAELSGSHWLIAPDIPGFGHSQTAQPYSISFLVEWLASFKLALRLPSIALVGHSFGGILASAFAAWYPEDATQLLLLAPALFSSSGYPTLLKKIGSSLGLLSLGSRISQSKVMVKRQIRVPFYDPETQDDSVWERRLADYEMARQSADVLKAAAFFDARPHLPSISQPTCIVWGLNDPVVPHSHAERIGSLLPNSEIHKLDECGHLPMLERPAEFLEVARRFLLDSESSKSAAHTGE